MFFRDRQGTSKDGTGINSDHKRIDWRRNAAFALFGATYLGAFQYVLQVNLYRRLFPHMDRFANQASLV
jgi:hypothetical protein